MTSGFIGDAVGEIYVVELEYKYISLLKGYIVRGMAYIHNF